MIHPLSLARWQQALLLLPLCLCISIVYKTTRCENLRDIPMAVLKNWVTVDCRHVRGGHRSPVDLRIAGMRSLPALRQHDRPVERPKPQRVTCP